MNAPADSRGRLPDYLLIGGMKCGSTSLHDQLDRHPDIFTPRAKEPGFFSRDERFARGIEWYKGLFAEATPGQRCGESSTCYTRWPHFGEVAPRIHEHLPDIKLVYIMRHPVDRAYSHYRHEMTERDRDKRGSVVSFEAALEETEEYVDSSLYLKQIERFLEHYSRDRFHFLLLDDLKREPVPTLRGVQEHLGLSVRDDLHLDKASNRIEHRIARGKAKTLFRKVRANPLVSLAAEVTPTWVKHGVRDFITDSWATELIMRRRTQAFAKKLSPLTSQTRQRLLERFERPNRELAEFLGRELPSAWSS